MTKEGASLKPVQYGMDWGYGMFSGGSVYGNLSTNINSYPLGVYNEKAGSITFPANSLYVSMADYQDGGAYPCTNPSYLYLSAEAYLNSLETFILYKLSSLIGIIVMCITIIVDLM